MSNTNYSTISEYIRSNNIPGLVDYIEEQVIPQFNSRICDEYKKNDFLSSLMYLLTTLFHRDHTSTPRQFWFDFYAKTQYKFETETKVCVLSIPINTSTMKTTLFNSTISLTSQPNLAAKQNEFCLYKLLALYPLYNKLLKSKDSYIPDSSSLLITTNDSKGKPQCLLTLLDSLKTDYVYDFQLAYFSDQVRLSLHIPTKILPLFQYHLFPSKPSLSDVYVSTTPFQAFILLFLYYFTTEKVLLKQNNQFSNLFPISEQFFNSTNTSRISSSTTTTSSISKHTIRFPSHPYAGSLPIQLFYQYTTYLISMTTPISPISVHNNNNNDTFLTMPTPKFMSNINETDSMNNKFSTDSIPMTHTLSQISENGFFFLRSIEALWMPPILLGGDTWSQIYSTVDFNNTDNYKLPKLEVLQGLRYLILHLQLSDQVKDIGMSDALMTIQKSLFYFLCKIIAYAPSKSSQFAKAIEVWLAYIQPSFMIEHVSNIINNKVYSRLIPYFCKNHLFYIPIFMIFMKRAKYFNYANDVEMNILYEVLKTFDKEMIQLMITLSMTIYKSGQDSSYGPQFNGSIPSYDTSSSSSASLNENTSRYDFESKNDPMNKNSFFSEQNMSDIQTNYNLNEEDIIKHFESFNEPIRSLPLTLIKNDIIQLYQYSFAYYLQADTKGDLKKSDLILQRISLLTNMSISDIRAIKIIPISKGKENNSSLKTYFHPFYIFIKSLTVFSSFYEINRPLNDTEIPLLARVLRMISIRLTDIIDDNIPKRFLPEQHYEDDEDRLIYINFRPLASYRVLYPLLVLFIIMIFIYFIIYICL